jgi:hypothetical protein
VKPSRATRFFVAGASESALLLHKRTSGRGPGRSTVAADRTVEVETYTWNVLPERHRQDLADGIAAELAWASGQLILEIR